MIWMTLKWLWRQEGTREVSWWGGAACLHLKNISWKSTGKHTQLCKKILSIAHQPLLYRWVTCRSIVAQDMCESSEWPWHIGFWKYLSSTERTFRLTTSTGSTNLLPEVFIKKTQHHGHINQTPRSSNGLIDQCCYWLSTWWALHGFCFNSAQQIFNFIFFKYIMVRSVCR